MPNVSTHGELAYEITKGLSGSVFESNISKLRMENVY